MNQRFVREASPHDAARIAEIYSEGIADRIATFETEARREDDVLAWFENDYPVMVAGEDGKVLAFAAAFPYRSRACYDGVREFSVYAARTARGRGFGKSALELLIAIAPTQGWWKLVSRVFPENAASRALCAKLGFREVGTYEKHGLLDGRWRDVVIVERLLI